MSHFNYIWCWIYYIKFKVENITIKFNSEIQNFLFYGFILNIYKSIYNQDNLKVFIMIMNILRLQPFNKVGSNLTMI